jgi:hypothetical protein
LLVNRIFVCEIEHSGFVQRSFNGRSGLFAISPSQNLSLTLAPTRRFPPPWTAELTPNCFIVRDADGQQLAYVYYESEPGRQSAAKLSQRLSG